MDITRTAEALTILSEYAGRVEVNGISKSYENAVPAPSTSYFLKVGVSENPQANDRKRLNALGWYAECDGLYWVCYAH